MSPEMSLAKQRHAKRMEENRLAHAKCMEELKRKMEEIEQTHAKRMEELNRFCYFL